MLDVKTFYDFKKFSFKKILLLDSNIFLSEFLQNFLASELFLVHFQTLYLLLLATQYGLFNLSIHS